MEIKCGYSACYVENNNWGYSYRDRKTFTTLDEAEVYAQELLKELKENAKISDDPDRVITEDSEGKVLREWYNDLGVVKSWRVRHG